MPRTEELSTIRVFVPVTFPLLRSRSMTRLRSWTSLTRIQARASGSPATVKMACTSGTSRAMSSMSSTRVLPAKRNSANASTD